jgi:hypothetical protein
LTLILGEAMLRRTAVIAAILIALFVSSQPGLRAQTIQYTVSGAGGGVFLVDDGLTVFDNGVVVFTDGLAASTVSHPPVTFKGQQGDSITDQVNDTYGFCTGLGALYLSCGGSSKPVLVDPGLTEFCGRPGGDQGISYTFSYKIPAIAGCGGTTIGSVEFTQAIQQYQLIADLQASLASNGEPPVPIIATKPAVMRVYLNTVPAATDVVLNITGTINDSKTVSLQPNCQPTDQRAHNNGCQSIDFYFKPPAGSWNVTLTLTDTQGNQLDQQILSPINSRTTNAINVIAVRACNDDPNGNNGCGPIGSLASQETSLMLIAPTASVTNTWKFAKIMESFQHDSYDPDTWNCNMAMRANALYTAGDQAADAAANQRSTYYGVFTSPLGTYFNVPAVNYGGCATFGQHGALGPSQSLWIGADVTADEMAHETTHTENLHHTAVVVTNKATAPPGCWNTAPGDPGVYWPYADNLIRDAEGLEYGFNVTTQTVIDPSKTFDIMSYCTPRWIAPIEYERMITTLGGGVVSASAQVSKHEHLNAVKEELAKPEINLVPTVVSGPYWQISGTIDPVNGTTLNPVFTETIAGSPDPGSGTYSIEVLGSTGQVLYTRLFTPTETADDTMTGTDETDTYFAEWVPVTTGAASFKVLDPNSNTLATLPIAGTAPTVTITSPAAGFVGSTNAQTISWTATEAGATNLTSRVLYSPDGGTTWEQIDETTGTTDVEDFTALPGSTNALIEVLVSDGVNTGSATSVPFTVVKKTPTVIQITSPSTGYAQSSADPVYLSGNAFDPDDGQLTGSALQWTSDQQGALGSGSPLWVKLNPGTHKITLTGTDSDGNAISTSITVLIGGGRPVLTLATNSLAANCTSATITAVPGTQGAPLSLVQYSVDGGNTYNNVVLASLPYSFIVPGSGAINLVARAYDQSRQSAAQSAAVTLPGVCSAGSPIASGGLTQTAPVTQPFATALSVTVSDALSNPVPGVTVNFTAPASGASATLSAATAVTGANGVASVNATANSTAGSYTVVGSVTGSLATALFNLTNTDFALSLDNSNLLVQHGSTTTATVIINPLSGFNSPVTLACTGLPTGVTCSFSPSSITPAGTSLASVLTVSAASNASNKTAAQNEVVGGGAFLALCVLGGLFRKRRRFLSLLGLLAVGILLSNTTACNGAFRTFNAGFSVTATSGTLTHTAPVTLTVK